MLRIFAVFILCTVVFCSCGQKTAQSTGENALTGVYPDSAQDRLENVDNDFSKGIWISQFDMKGIYLDKGRQRDKESFTALSEEVLGNVVKMGFDTVYFQVHPYGDSFYSSDYFPWSEYVCGEYSLSPSYDPFEVICDICKELGLSLHAWINPMRLQSFEKAKLLSDGSPYTRLLKNNSGEICFFEGRYYFDPSYENVRELIACVAEELARNYPIDGVHIDDYFYPTEEASFDKIGYERYKEEGGRAELGEFRRESVSLMVKEIYEAVKQVDKRLVFSISPAGNAKNVYESMYADIYRWCGEGGYCDLVIPQLYYGLRHEKFPFDKALASWEELCKGGRVKLIIGVTFSKIGLKEDIYAGTGRYEWAQDEDILAKSARCVADSECASGIAVFSYGYIVSDEAEAERKAFLKVLQEM